MVWLKEEECKRVITRLEDNGISVWECGRWKMQIRFYVHLKNRQGRQCPIVWKSKMARRVAGLTLAA